MIKKTTKKSKKLLLTSEKVREASVRSLPDDKLQNIVGGSACTDSDGSISHWR